MMNGNWKATIAGFVGRRFLVLRLVFSTKMPINHYVRFLRKKIIEELRMYYVVFLSILMKSVLTLLFRLIVEDAAFLERQKADLWIKAVYI